MIVLPGEQIAWVRAGSWDADVSWQTLSDVEITHGRESFTDYAQAGMSTARFTLAVPRDTVNYWFLGPVGSTIRIDTVAGRRFTGHITDLDYEWVEKPEGWFLMYRTQCVGTMSRLGSTLLTATSWPEQTTSARVSAIFAGSADANRIEPGDFNPVKLAVTERDPGKSALKELEELLFEGEAVMYSDTDGTNVWQQYAWRNTRLTIVDLPPDAVQFAPSYAQKLDCVNTVTLEYGAADPRGTVVSYHHDSRFYLGVWWERYATEYRDAPDAQKKADRTTRRQGYPPTLLPGVSVLLNRLDAATFAKVCGLRVGHKVRLPRLPDPYPSPYGPGQSNGVWIVEGWTEYIGSKYDPDNTWRLVLHLSPPIWSMVGKTWAEFVPTGERWMDFPSTTWDEIGEL